MHEQIDNIEGTNVMREVVWLQ